MSKQIRKGKIIVIEGGDGSGKETQTNLLVKSLRALGVEVATFDFPHYQSPTGKVVGGAYLGKSEISKSFFKEGARNVDWRVASLYYAADRLYNLGEVKNLLDSGTNVILDRYVLSNMAYQASKSSDCSVRNRRYQWLDLLEYGLLGLPRPDAGIYLEVPVETTLKLMKGRKKDEHERDENILRAASVAYKEVAIKYDLAIINCINSQGEMRSREAIASEVLAAVADKLRIKLPQFGPSFYWN